MLRTPRAARARATGHPGRSLLLGSCLAVACGAGAKQAPSSPPPAAPASAAVAPGSSAESPPPAPQGPMDSPGFVDALAMLRPAAAEPAVAQLAAAPAEAELYARAALAYA